MARPGPETHAKRQREYAKKEKRRAKEQRKATRKAAKTDPAVDDASASEGAESASPETVGSGT